VAVAEPQLQIRPLTPETFDRLGELFAEGGDPRWCWCAFWRLRGSGGLKVDAAENRALLAGLAQRGNPAPGLVALRDGRVVGWVSLGPRDAYPRLTHSKVYAPVDDRPVWSIVCFVVSRPERGQGVGGALLAAAVEHARRHGATTLEGYPVDAGAGRVPAGRANTGTVSMFTRAGFTLVATRQATPTARPRLIMRRELAPAGPG
jgi:GNAT superfamily N-acetyltransferase